MLMLSFGNTAVLICFIFLFYFFAAGRYDARVEKADKAEEGDHWEFLIVCSEDHTQTSCRRRHNDFKTLAKKLGEHENRTQ